MEFLTAAAENWDKIMAGLIIMVASGGKVAEMFIKTVANVKEAYQDAFINRNPWK